MANRTPSKWLMACLHYNEPWESFLVKAVKPYIDVVMQTGVAERFFFQRSWIRGPHIRLYFKGNPFILESMLKPNLSEHFSHYFESRPSQLVEPSYPEGFPADIKWRPNNSVHFCDYVPGPERRGGKLEFSLFEKQFQASSEIILQTIKEKADHWTYNEIIGTAVKLHLSLAYSVGMSLGEAGDFFQGLFDTWEANHQNGVDDEKTKYGGPAVRSFQEKFDRQRKDIMPYHSALWELFKNYRKLNDSIYIDWIHINTKLSLKMDLALESGKLALRPNIFTAHPFQDKSQEQRWNYCEELIRLTNDRLGLHQNNEGYLYYSMAQSLHSLTKTKPVFSQMEQ